MRAIKQKLSYLILGQKGGKNRIQIIELLKERPYNLNQLAENLNVNWRTIKHHINILTRNDLVSSSKTGEYGEIYFLAPEMERSMDIFEDVIKKLSDFTTSPRFFQNVIEQTNDAVIIINNDFETYFWNKSAKNIFGYSEDDILGQVIPFFPDPNMLEKMLKKVINGEPIIAFETKLKHKTEKLIDVCLTIDTIKDENDNQLGFSILSRDITERKQAEEKLAKHKEHLEELVKERTIELTRSKEQLLNEITERKRAQEKTERLNLVLRTIRNVNQLIIKERDRKRLLQGACDNLIENRGYYYAWIALLDNSNVIIETAEAGLGNAFLPILDQLEQGKLTRCMENTLKHSDLTVIEDPLTTCIDCPLAVLYSGRGAITARLEHDNRVYGILSASIPKEFITDKNEKELFREVTNDIAFALNNLEIEEERKKEEETLREIEKKSHLLIKQLQKNPDNK